MPVLMHQARILWDRGDYAELEKLFARTSDYCSDVDTWKLNVAHVLYMSDLKYQQAASFYEPIVHKHYDNVRRTVAYPTRSLSVTPQLLLLITSS